MKKHIEKLNGLHVCEKAVEWAKNYDTIEEVVKNCHRGDWLLRLARKLNVNLRKLTLAKGYCANTVRHLMTNERSREAVDVSIKFGRFEASRDKLEAAADAAADVVNTYSYSAAYSDTAYSAAYSAAAAAAADDDYAVASASAYAVAAEVYEAAAAAYVTSPAANQLQTSDICRKYIGNEIIEKFNKLK